MDQLRKRTQIISLLLLHASWGPEFKWLCNPVLSCHSCVLAWFACPIGVFVHYSAYQLIPFFALGTVLLIGGFFGRLLCGWVCPFGFIQDLLHKAPTRKFALPPWTANIKYAVLLLMVVGLPFFLGENTAFSFCRICPAAALQVTVPGIVVGTVNASSGFTVLRLAVLVGVIALAVFSYRSFCKTLCPIGALLAPLNFVSLWSIKPARESCLSCQKCDKACKLDLAPSGRVVNNVPASRDLDCVLCYDCQTACKELKTEN